MNHLYQWAEKLPKNCPPPDAYQPKGEVFYRVLKGDPAKEEDFYSQRRLAPNQVFKDVSECTARAVSLFANEKYARDLLKIPKFKGGLVAEVELHPQDGLVLETKHRTTHYSWWRSTAFNFMTARIIS